MVFIYLKTLETLGWHDIQTDNLNNNNNDDNVNVLLLLLTTHNNKWINCHHHPLKLNKGLLQIVSMGLCSCVFIQFSWNILWFYNKLNIEYNFLGSWDLKPMRMNRCPTENYSEYFCMFWIFPYSICAIKRSNILILRAGSI